MTSGTVELAWTESGAGPPLLLIMGLNAAGDAWTPHTDAWQRTFRCLRVDNRGAGRSPAPPGRCTTEALADDYAALVDRLGLGPSRVVGISMGGAVAQQLALRHPGLVERMVLVATWARPHPYLTAVLDVLGTLRRSSPDPVFGAHLQTLVWTPGWFADHEAELVAGRAEPLPTSADGLASQLAACADHDALALLPGVDVPTLVTAGRDDRFVPPALTREVADALPRAELVPFATGHVHHWEELDRFNRICEEFLHG